MSRHQRLELLIFISCFFAFAYFNQGGGWNQNARFAEVRAMAEEGRFAIDDYLVYQNSADGDDLQRAPLHRAEYKLDGKRYRLCWVDMEWNLLPVGDDPLEEGVEKAAMVEVCASGDIGYVPWTGEFHPNKPPGASFFGLPGYFLLYRVEKLFGVNPDHWWTLEFNAWMTTVCSVALVSALGCVLFFRIALSLSGGATLASLLATITLAFGTTFFPFATILFDHDLTASLLIASYYFLRRGNPDITDGITRRRAPEWCFFLSGMCAGLAAVTNYVAACAGVLLGLYALLATPRGKWNWRGAVGFTVGVLPPLFLICWYAKECFGSPFTLNTDFQNPLFQDSGGALFGMFPIPRDINDVFRLGYVAALLTYSPIRGLFFVSPIMVFAFFGLWTWVRRRDLFADALLCGAIFLGFFLVNVGFNGYHGGFSAGPRYLIPGLPFLALGLVVPLVRWRWLAYPAAVASIGINTLLTATDAQNPVGIGGHARVDGHSEWSYNLLSEYAWPLFTAGRDWPLLEQQIQFKMRTEDIPRIEKETTDPTERTQRIAELRRKLMDSIDRGEVSPFLLGSVEGPVSVNPLGVYEGLFTYVLFPPGSPQCRWASFNVGEFIWPQSRWSLLPLLLVSGGGSLLAIWLAAKERKRSGVA